MYLINHNLWTSYIAMEDVEKGDLFDLPYKDNVFLSMN